MQFNLSKLCKAPLALAFLMSASSALFAQNADQRNNIQVYGSALQYHGELGEFEKNSLDYGGGLSFNRYLSRSFDGGLHLSYGKTTPNNYRGNMDAKIGTAMVGLRLKAYGTILKEDAFIGPYLMVAGGASHNNSAGTIVALGGAPASAMGNFEHSFVSWTGFGGAGIRFRFSDKVSAFVQSGIHFTTSDKMDNIELYDNNEKFLQHTVGLGFNLGKGKDTDADGVPDRRDKCPDTPAGVQVDRDGCPIDTDGDGVPDYLDQCPNEAGTAATQGCPDRDGDGVADKDDRCPDEAGSAALGGCPDSDGDGVADIDDKCPDTPAGVQVGPDGCPIDTDGDGIPDHEDLCPNSAGPADKGGCPELDARTLKLMEEKVRFEFDQARVQDGYRQLLDSIVVALERYPDHVLLIKGHADHIGSEEYNQQLSESRAQAVKEYLISRGVQNPDRMVVRGYGESQPLVQVNTRLSAARTAAARAQNRRVGFEMNTPDMKLDMQ